jgi:hypothetical protein
MLVKFERDVVKGPYIREVEVYDWHGSPLHDRPCESPLYLWHNLIGETHHRLFHFIHR